MNKITANIFKPSRIQDGRRVRGTFYVLRWSHNGKLQSKAISLQVRDRQVAEKMMADFIRDKERELNGLAAPKPLRDAAQKFLCDHVTDFAADKASCNKDEEYVYTLEKRLVKLIKECGWQFSIDVTADSFGTWRNKQSLAAKTLNDYLADCRNFLNWMERNGRMVGNPLKFVGKVETRGKQRRNRRAFREDEIRRLLAVAGPRRIVYLAAVNTGLRRAEMAQLQIADLHLKDPEPFVCARSSTTKNHKDGVLWINEELCQELKKLVDVEGQGTEPVFPEMPGMKQFRKDLSAAGIPYKDAQGRVADFHALRHTLCTNLNRAGVPIRHAMGIMRHSDMRLTNSTYTDEAHLPLAEAIGKLPTFGASKLNALGNALKLVASSPKLSFGVHSEGEAKVNETLENTGDSPFLSPAVPSGTNEKLVAWLGFEPSESPFLSLLIDAHLCVSLGVVKHTKCQYNKGKIATVCNHEKEIMCCFVR